MPKMKYKEIPTGEIRESKFHWKREIDQEHIEDLGRTIEEVGMIHPITVIKKAKGKGYEYIAGERRFLAARKAGLKTVPCLVRDLNEIEAAETSIYENLQREDMSPAEQDAALRRLVALKREKMEIYDGTPVTTKAAVAEVAKDAQLSKSTIDRALAVNNLIKEARAVMQMDTLQRSKPRRWQPWTRRNRKKSCQRCSMKLKRRVAGVSYQKKQPPVRMETLSTRRLLYACLTR